MLDPLIAIFSEKHLYSNACIAPMVGQRSKNKAGCLPFLDAQLDKIDLQVAEPEDKDFKYSPPTDPDVPDDGPKCSKRQKRVKTQDVLPCQDPLPNEFVSEQLKLMHQSRKGIYSR